MKYLVIIGCICSLAVACVREKYEPGDCREQTFFVMQEVPYIFEGEEAVGYGPYYTFTERLDLLVFSGGKLSRTLGYDYEYCRSHPVIPLERQYPEKDFLFVANLFHPGDMEWKYGTQGPAATFFIREYEEPSVYLAAVARMKQKSDSLDVRLQMLVSRLEIRLVDPPAWVTGLDVTVRNIAGSVTMDHQLGDTTHIRKQLFFDNQGAGTYSFGVNAFPTYPDKAASLTMDLIGTSEAAPVVVQDSRLHLAPGQITRVEIVFDSGQKITVSIEIDGRWEVVEGGSIII